MQRYHRTLLVIVFLTHSHLVRAHQPVMDMAPRWDNGYGFQVRHAHYGSDELIDGDNDIANPLGLERNVDKTWLEGVYTFDRSVRITFKQPWIDQDRVKDIGGTGVKQSNSGWGDLIVGMPLKKYFNRADSTGNISLTPSLRMPTGSTSGDFPVADGSWDAGLSVSYSKSTTRTYQLYDLFYWHNNRGRRGMREGNELGLDINVGYHPWHDNLRNAGMFVMWDVTARHSEAPNDLTLTTASGGTRVHTGPVIVLYRDNIMFRAEYKIPAWENSDDLANSRGDQFDIGIGATF